MRQMLSIADRGKDRVLRRRGREESRSSSQIGEKELEGGGREAMKGKDIKGVLDLCIYQSLSIHLCHISLTIVSHYQSLSLIIISHSYLMHKEPWQSNRRPCFPINLISINLQIELNEIESN